jgi:hypothetical protein
VGLWRRIRRHFSNSVGAIVGEDRVFGTDSECLDDGIRSVEELFEPIGRVVREHLRPERVRACASERRWFVRFFAGDRPWSAWFDPRDYSGVFDLVNAALHDGNAPRRLRVVTSRDAGQEFQVAYATPQDVADLLDAGWIVEAALPDVPHVIEHDGLRFFGDRPYRLGSHGHVIDAVLSERRVVQGIPCEAGERVSFVYEGGLSCATLAEDVTLGRYTFRAGSCVSFWEGGELVPAEIELREAHTIDGFPCGPGTVGFREDGSLQELVLSRAHPLTKNAGPYRGREAARGARLWFDDAGTIESIDDPLPDGGPPVAPFDRPPGERPLRAVVHGVPILAHEDVELGPDGTVYRAIVAEDAVVEDIPLRGGLPVRFDDGHVAEATLSRVLSISGATLAAGSIVELWEPGALSRGVLASDQTIDGLPCRGGSEVQLFDAGGLAECTLREAVDIGGIRVPAGARVRRGSNGLSHVALPADGELLGFAALGGVWLEVDAAGRRVTRILDAPPR